VEARSCSAFVALFYLSGHMHATPSLSNLNPDGRLLAVFRLAVRRDVTRGCRYEIRDQLEFIRRLPIAYGPYPQGHS
jgi:hypothetical protein